MSGSNTTTSLSTLATNSLATANGDLVFVAGTCGNTGSYSVNNDFTEGIERKSEKVLRLHPDFLFAFIRVCLLFKFSPCSLLFCHFISAELLMS
jgi:hypothetical protein